MLKRYVICVLTLFSFIIVRAQDAKQAKIAKSIVEEGKLLYRLESASWVGTDLFIAKFSNKDSIGGYFSYIDGDTVKCIFYSSGATPKVIGSIAFGGIINNKNAKMNLSERKLTKLEKEYYEIRSATIQALNKDTFFAKYNGMDFNTIPLITNGARKVYILTSPKSGGKVIFGNDYVVEFDIKGKVIAKKMLHNNIISTPYANDVQKKNGDMITFHSHAATTGDYITATDICTLLLYQQIAGWSKHIVKAGSFYSLWDCHTNELEMLTKEALDARIKK